MKCVVLLSGGLDSATVVAMAKDLGFEPIALTISYGQRHKDELEAARRVAAANQIQDHRFIDINLDTIGGSALTADIDVPKDHLGEGIPITYVPARNTVFLSIALGLAEVADAHDIFIGVNAVDYSGYPDCRPEFIQAFEKLANLATKEGVEGRGFRIHAPLIGMTKADIIRRGKELGVDYAITLSCYDPIDGQPCGHCDACLIRNRAFAEVEIDR